MSSNRRSEILTRTLAAVLIVSIGMCIASCANRFETHRPSRVLLIGNSVTYTNNLPAMIGAIATARSSSAQLQIDMFARGGANLHRLSADGRLIKTIETGSYDFVVLQERGGDVFCGHSPEDKATEECAAMVKAHDDLALAARRSGARVIYLGTYQFAERPSQSLVSAEKLMSARIGADYIEISETLRNLQRTNPALPWVNEDKGHPGVATTYLMAVRIYRVISNREQPMAALCMQADLYDPQDKFSALVEFDTSIHSTAKQRCILTEREVRQVALAIR